MRWVKVCALLVAWPLAPECARAAEFNWYIAGSAGASLFAGSDGYYVESVDQDGVSWFSTQGEPGTGALGGVALGLRQGVFRAEMEGGYRSMTVRSLFVSNGNGTFEPGGSGTVSAGTAMLNLYAGLPFAADPMLIGYLGLGAGGARLSFHDVPSSNYFDTKYLDSAKWVSALQVMLGIEWLNIPGLESIARRGDSPAGFWSFFLQYRLLATGDAELLDSGGQPVKADGLVNHELQLGVCYNFL